jgi:hypothetical protein
MEAERARVGEALGYELEFTPQEAAALGVAVAAADRIADLEAVYEAERRGPARPATLVKLAGEIRGQQRAQLDALARVRLDPDYLSNVRRDAVRQRWNGVRRYA